MAEPTFVPTGFIVPFEFVTEQFRLEPLGPTHNDADYEAWSSSADHIHATPGWENSAWPDTRTAADNLRDLRRHAQNHADAKKRGDRSVHPFAVHALTPLMSI